MPAVDLAAIRAAVRDLVAKLRAVPIDGTALTGPYWYGQGWKDAVDHLEEITEAWPGDEPSLLGRIAELEAALGRADKRHDDVARQLGERRRELMAARRAADDWRDIAEARDREAKAEAHPPVDRYRVQVWDAADADLPSWGWSSISSARDTADEAVEVMARRRERRPEFGPMRVIRVRESYAVVATEDPKPEKPPESPQDAPADPETRATG